MEEMSLIYNTSINVMLRSRDASMPSIPVAGTNTNTDLSNLHSAKESGMSWNFLLSSIYVSLFTKQP